MSFQYYFKGDSMEYKCSVCGDQVEGDLVVFTEHTEKHIIDEIKSTHPEWAGDNGVCVPCAEYFRKQLKGE